MLPNPLQPCQAAATVLGVRVSQERGARPSKEKRFQGKYHFLRMQEGHLNATK